jgi:hypothetical protein
MHHSSFCPKERAGYPFLWDRLTRLIASVFKRPGHVPAGWSRPLPPERGPLPALAPSRIAPVAHYDPGCMLCVRVLDPGGPASADGMCDAHMLLVYGVDRAVEQAARPIGSAHPEMEVCPC